jgi:hypothetical protein
MMKSSLFERGPVRMLLCASSCWSRQAQEEEESVVLNSDSSRRRQTDGEPITLKIDDSGERKIITSSSAATETVVAVSQTSTNLASPRAWLESLPDGAYTVIRCDLTLAHDGGAAIISDDGVSAATSLSSSSRPPKTCHVWGLDFHLQRLQQSYEGGGFLFRSSSTTTKEEEEKNSHENVETATASTIRILNTLLQQAVLELPHFVFRDKNEGPHVKLNDGASTPYSVVVMVTILWHPPNSQEKVSSSLTGPSSPLSSSMIQVQGHILCTGTPTATITGAGHVVDYNPAPITAVLATTTLENNLDGSEQRLPNRKNNQPGCKLSNWCQKRLPLEELFLQKHIALLCKDISDNNSGDVVAQTVVNAGEVLLTNRIENNGMGDCVQLELLEGLTSNLFVVLNGGKVLCTPPAASALISNAINDNVIKNHDSRAAVETSAAGHVLPGFARQRIIDCARNLGMHVQVSPIILSIPSSSQKDNDHLAHEQQPPWEEVFCTSSIKLVTPVERILVPSCIGNNNITAHANDGVGSSTSLNFQQVWCSRMDEATETTTTIRTPVWKLLYNEILRQELQYQDQEQT